MMVNLPTFRQLSHLVALADDGHFGRAAKACHVTQSTLSASIKELENILQASLVDRTKRTVLLTPLGREIAARARRILNDGKDLVEAARAGSEPLSGALRLGVIATVGPFLLPDILPRLRRAYPALKLYLVEDLTGRLVEELQAGRLDIVLLALPCDDCKNLESRVLFRDFFEVALPSGHPLAVENAIDLGRLRSEELLLLKEGHCLREHALAACRLADRRLIDTVEATSLLTLVQMVDNGLGITLLPQLAIDGGILKGTAITVLPISREPPSREIGLVWRHGSGRQREFELLASVLKQFVAERPAMEMGLATV
jgi:LysR family hydrogen peroxide-inducible transcriptional activator